MVADVLYVYRHRARDLYGLDPTAKTHEPDAYLAAPAKLSGVIRDRFVFR